MTVFAGAMDLLRNINRNANAIPETVAPPETEDELCSSEGTKPAKGRSIKKKFPYNTLRYLNVKTVVNQKCHSTR